MSQTTIWTISLVIGLVAALTVAALLTLIVRTVRGIDTDVARLLGVAGTVATNTASIPHLRATAPVLEEIVAEAIVQDGYMNALTDGYGGIPAGTARATVAARGDLPGVVE
jgi:predicted permease